MMFSIDAIIIVFILFALVLHSFSSLMPYNTFGRKDLDGKKRKWMENNVGIVFSPFGSLK